MTGISPMREGVRWSGSGPRDGEKPAGCGAGKGRQRRPPHIDAAASPQQFWEMAAICTAAAIYMNLLQPLMASVISSTGWPDPHAPPPPRPSYLPLLALC